MTIDTDFFLEVDYEVGFIPFDLFFSFFAFLYEFIAFFFPSFNEFLVDRLKEVKDFSFLVVCKYYVFYTFLYFSYFSNLDYVSEFFRASLEKLSNYMEPIEE